MKEQGKGLLLSPTELLKRLKTNSENRRNTTVSANGYEKGDGYDRRRYKVALSTSVNL